MFNKIRLHLNFFYSPYSTVTLTIHPKYLCFARSSSKFTHMIVTFIPCHFCEELLMGPPLTFATNYACHLNLYFCVFLTWRTFPSIFSLHSNSYIFSIYFFLQLFIYFLFLLSYNSIF